jgi:uncharacterized membrane protein YeiB
MQKNRIVGYDIARALAIFIMVIINFNLVLSNLRDTGILSHVLSFLQGKGAALFVVLAGAGISLMIKKSLQSNNKLDLKKKRRILLKRALFLFVTGLIYMPLWPADILHYYGFYILISVLVMHSKNKIIWTVVTVIIAMYPVLMLFIDYEAGWNWTLNEYTNFWSIQGFTRNLLINGFHPVLPWVAFMIAGLWLGRQDMSNTKIRKQILWTAMFVFMATQLISSSLIEMLISILGFSIEDATAILGTQPMPPMPLFMISGISWSFAVTAICVWISEKSEHKKSLDFLVKTGQLAFTHYIVHIVVGILSAYLFFGENNLSSIEALLYAFLFYILLVVFSIYWRKKFKKGPISLLMRLITG